VEASTLFMTGNSYCIYIITTIYMACHMCLFLEKKIRIKIYYKSKVAKCNVNVIHSFFIRIQFIRILRLRFGTNFFRKWGNIRQLQKKIM